MCCSPRRLEERTPSGRGFVDDDAPRYPEISTLSPFRVGQLEPGGPNPEQSIESISMLTAQFATMDLDDRMRLHRIDAGGRRVGETLLPRRESRCSRQLGRKDSWILTSPPVRLSFLEPGKPGNFLLFRSLSFARHATVIAGNPPLPQQPGIKGARERRRYPEG